MGWGNPKIGVESEICGVQSSRTGYGNPKMGKEDPKIEIESQILERNPKNWGVGSQNRGRRDEIELKTGKWRAGSTKYGVETENEGADFGI